MKILCLIEDLGPGGAQRQLVNLAIEFVQRGHQVKFVYYVRNDFYVPVLLGAGIQVDEAIEPKPLRRILKIRKVIRTGKFDIVISFLSPSNLIANVASLPFRKWKLIVGERSANPLILRSVKSRFIRYTHLLCDFVVSNSYANMKMVRKVNPFLGDKSCKVIYNMLDVEQWAPPTDFRFRNAPKLKIVVGASHRYLKNLIGLLEALQLLNENERAQLQIDWYGNSINAPFFDNSFSEAFELVNQSMLSNVIRFHPASSEVRVAMADADVVALFSFFEGLPNTVCEGMALGKPIFATRVSDVPLLVSENVNGFLCDAKDPSTIADGLRYFLNASSDALRQMGANSRTRAVTLFDKRKIVEAYEELMKG
jgi:glycosyltransferase involved in cell wall biosynthesis